MKVRTVWRLGPIVLTGGVSKSVAVIVLLVVLLCGVVPCLWGAIAK